MNPAEVAKLAFAGTTSSAAGAGAAAGYGHFIPKTFDAIMAREGGAKLTSDTDFKSVIFDQKDKVDSFIKFAAPDKKNTITKIEDKLAELRSWCNTHKDKPLEEVNDTPKYADYYINFCSTKGIKTVKGFLTKWRSQANWIEERDSKDHEISYKGVFAVYRNSNDFLNWINERKDNKNKSFTSATKISEGYSELKKVCEKGLKMSWASRTNKEMEQYAFFCTVGEKDTVEERLKSQDKTWTTRTKWDNVKDTWYQTEGVQDTIKRINKDLPVGNEDYKKWCEDRLKARLGSAEEVYPNDYKFVKQICREGSTPTKP